VSVTQSTESEQMSTEERSSQVALRANRLERSLRKLGVHAPGTAVICCCATHAEDQHVALRAVHAIGLRPDVVAHGVDGHIPPLDVVVVLACGEGLSFVRPTRGTVVSDAPGTYWWRMLELRGSAEVPDPFSSDEVEGHPLGSVGSTPPPEMPSH
jgi:hypothetical protein